MKPIEQKRVTRSAQHEFHALLNRFTSVRKITEKLAAPLSAEDCNLQSMPDTSPVKWHLAHTSWFFETFILERFEHFTHDFKPFHPAFRVLFNSYYNGIGDKHPRHERGLISRRSWRGWRIQRQIYVQSIRPAWRLVRHAEATHSRHLSKFFSTGCALAI